MNVTRFALLPALLGAAALAACGQRPADPPARAPQAEAGAAPEPTTALGRTVAKAMDEARAKLREGNLSLNGDYDVNINGKRLQRKASDLPRAEITPQGDLIVSGRTIAMDDRSRALALRYREGLIAVAEAGMDIGVQGADLGMKAAGDAIASIFRGDTDGVEKRIEAEAQRLEASALRLCDSLPALLAAQQALAAAVPEFAPYATMDAGDIDDCRDDHTPSDPPDGDTATAAMNAAAEADAAADAASAAVAR